MSAGQVPVGGGDDAHVDLDRVLAADPLEGLLLQHAQHLRLHLQAHVADLVEEQRAAVGQLELAAAPGERAGERALLVAEQLGLDQLLGDRGAVDLHERAPRAGPSRAWIARATSSLPVPFSPWIRTRPVVGAAVAICSTQRPDGRALADDLGPLDRGARAGSRSRARAARDRGRG